MISQNVGMLPKAKPRRKNFLQSPSFGLSLLAGLGNIDASRHAIERIDPAAYLSLGYYGCWLRYGRPGKAS